uniref:Uncharacterized protein n=1 Tax=Amphimedon queenslandica TaxID=400682 RepID=A0A1X7TX04_AMPQE
MMRPNITSRVENKQLSQKKHYDSRAKERSFMPQDGVYVRSSGPSSLWIAGKIEAKLGNVHYDVRLDDKRLVRRHVDDIQAQVTESSTPTQPEPEPLDIPYQPPPDTGSTSHLEEAPPLPEPQGTDPLGFAARQNGMDNRFQSNGGGM